MSALYRHRAGLTERRIGPAVFLAHRGRATVVRLNETGSALWRLLASPLSAREAVAVFQQAFPRRRAEDVARSVRDLLDTMIEDDLLELVATRAATRGRRGRTRRPTGR